MGYKSQWADEEPYSALWSSRKRSVVICNSHFFLTSVILHLKTQYWENCSESAKSLHEDARNLSYSALHFYLICEKKLSSKSYKQYHV